MLNKNIIQEKEAKLKKLAKIAWDLSLKEFYFPPLNEPRYVFDYKRKEGFYIDPNHKWEITMNLANVPPLKDDEEYIQYFHAILLHEISHYQIIPYDGIIHAKLLHAANKHVHSTHAPLVVNLFADLIIDTKLYKAKPDLMKWEIKKTFEHVAMPDFKSLSRFSKFLFNIYEKLWNIKIYESFTSPETDALANKIKKIILTDFEDDSRWEEKVSKVAYYLKDFLKEEFTIMRGAGAPLKGKSRRKIPGYELEMEIPDDVLEIIDNPLETKNSDKLKKDNEDELRKKAEEFAKNIPYSEFGAPARQSGILIDGNALATWYRGLANNLISIKIYEKKYSGTLPIYPEKWRIGDPIEELDAILTIVTSPIIIPNVTTKKWKHERGVGRVEEKRMPDLLIVLDSSGSMYWNFMEHVKNERGPYHAALVASFAILHQARMKGVKFSVINFSNHAEICEWSKNYHEAENVLLRYQGGGTQLPIKAIKKQVNKAEGNVLIFIITDFGIYNWTRSKQLLLELVQKGHKIVGFFIGSEKIPKNKFKGLLDKVSFYAIKNEKDLIHLVIKEIKKYYS